MATANVNTWDNAAGERAALRSAERATMQVLKICGSLKVTVTLFALSMVLVLVGTLAQEDLNMVEVKARYFTSWIAMMRLEDFVPQAFVRHDPIPGEIPFPGGALIGLLLMVNLVAAKVTRFHVRASSGRLALGASIFAFGLLLCYGVVAWGNSEGVQGEPPITYKTLWSGLVAGMAVLWLTALFEAFKAKRFGWRLIWIAIAVAFGGLGLASLLGIFSMSASSLRITWQLIEGTIVATVLLVGSRIMFGAQGANLLLHFGVALLMLGQFIFGDTQLEQRLSLVEGQSTNTLVNMDHIELAFIETLADGKQRITVVPESKLKLAFEQQQLLKDDRLPVDMRVLSFFDNSDLTSPTAENPATKGTGLEVIAKEIPKAGGTNSEVDLASAYVEFLSKENGESLGVHLVSQILNERAFLSIGGKEDMSEELLLGDKSYQVQLRFERVPKPYWVQVKDVRRVNYSGTQTPRDYSSFIKLVDTETGNVENARVWMNNPLRYRGETFYQSDYQQLPGGKEFTSIQVVRNAGWMIPYIACMIVAVGMIAHFTGTLDRFLGRRERELARNADVVAATPEEAGAPTKSVDKSAGGLKHLLAVGWLPAVAVGLSLLALIPWSTVMMAMRPDTRETTMDTYRAGEIPVRFGGRVMPLDAYATTTLRAISNKTSLPLKADNDEVPPAPLAMVKRAGDAKKLPALNWLFEVASGSQDVRDLQMFRIDADEVLAHFSLQRRPSKLYSLQELIPGLQEFDKIVREAAEKDALEQTFKERKFLKLASRINAFEQLSIAFTDPFAVLPAIPPQFDRPDLTAEQRQQIQLMVLQQQMERLETAPVAAVVPPTTETTTASIDTPPWKPLAPVKFNDVIATIRGEEPTPGAKSFSSVVEAYADEDASAFNSAVNAHLEIIAEAAPRDYHAQSVGLERWLEAVHPTVIACLLYGIMLLLGIIGLAVNSPLLKSSVWGGLTCVLVVHTLVLLARIYITGRAPVINLYSSAVFIGWATVVFGLLYERIFRQGVGNIIASTTGMLTLMVAWALSDGDTMPVLQAVLDTQFWLATHVITVTLGYAATFAAGALGIAYLFSLLFTGKTTTPLLRDIYRMTYSATCFGILFSFVGTVLGGLWADDSWGRFWGWDPKENGALLIVIWNALMLHARWDGMVRERGFAILAIGGNIVTAWSWFGTNQLGIGLHSYGFTSGALMLLTLFALSQLAVMGMGIAMVITSNKRSSTNPEKGTM